MGKTQFQPVSQILALASLATLAFSSQSLAQSQETCDLSGTISQILQRPEQQQTQWGIAIQDPQTENLLFEHQADTFFVPASNQKLLTTAAALVSFGPNYQYQTPIYTVGTAPNLEKLIIRGVGDPSLTTEKLTTALSQLSQQQIHHIDQVILDSSHFPEPGVNPTWEWSDLSFYYGVPITSLMLNENAVVLTVFPTESGQTTTVGWSDDIAAQQWQLENQMVTAPDDTPYSGSLTQTYGTTTLTLTGKLAADAMPDIWGLSIPDPDRYALDKIIQILGEQGITVGKSLTMQTPILNLDQAQPLGAIASDPLAEILKTTNQDSNNLFAESLLKTLTAADRNPETILESIGVNPATYRLRDGSGLSRHNLVTPMALIQTLDGMLTHPQGETYRNSLAIAGRTGTLQNRFQDTPVENQFFGKTGTMTHVSGLSGYLDLPDDSTLLVSILANQTGQSARITRQAIDDVVVAVHDWHSCSTTQP
ncbi:D-alanyl-D-alanine carboxypeptidase/D-alanyl-D-alanine-endopeptidase [Picosynechococcus sp. NKBG042902]|uniref:D-alanyl-D-alanine carboxypeptidase/D-alanyl-D-alanine endopeptidase n=1 Tax=Picosynechococcus sp. NKBG042902 TaxID=490193 RepID=UPI0004AA6C67|nr:D-alanyl-D-alanine carboxypeptidase/D-alanyl-D-alanine-endopeptidase [Picosynechococcus sp. NKBG042902]